MESTLHGALAARGIETCGQLVTDIEGDYAYVPRDPNVPGLLNDYPLRLLDAVRLTFRFTVPPGKREEAEQAMNALEDRCAVYRSLKRGIKLTYGCDIKEENRG
jgi:hypothetical protein